MSGHRITVVEDEDDIREILEYTLTREGFAVESASDGAGGLELIRRRGPDLVLLDLMLPDLDGLEICRQLKAEGSTAEISIIIVSAKGEESDIVLGLGLGADDYVTKPFRPRELVARVRSVLRRRDQPQPLEWGRMTVVRGPLRIDPERHRAWIEEVELELTATELRILHLLASHPGRIFSRAQILSEARGELAAAFERSVDAHVRTIRKKLGAHRELVETVRSIGYRFQEQSIEGADR
jgi:DNA-binding response OmpR family regulator